MNVTDGDRERAVRVLVSIPDSNDRVGTMAQALAEERERARAPFLALADELDERRAVYAHAATGSHDAGINAAYYVAADRIRRAAEDER